MSMFNITAISLACNNKMAAMTSSENTSQFTNLVAHFSHFLVAGVFILNIIVLTLNTDLSDTAPVTKRNSYVQLVLFNVAAVILAKEVTEGIAHAFDVVGGTLEAIHVLGVTFLISVYRTIFLSLDCLYHAYAKLKYSGERCRFIDDLRRGDKMIVINI